MIRFSVGVNDLNGQRMPQGMPQRMPKMLKDVHILDSSELTKDSYESVQLSRIGNLCNQLLKRNFRIGPSEWICVMMCYSLFVSRQYC